MMQSIFQDRASLASKVNYETCDPIQPFTTNYLRAIYLRIHRH